MYRGMYTAVSGMIAAERTQQMLNHNMANAQTPGYKQDTSVHRSFPEMLIQRMGGQQAKPFGSKMPGQPSPLGTLHTGVYAQEGIPLFTQGPLMESGRATDVAIVDQMMPINPDTGQQGHVFYAVQTDTDDVRYTRNGNFYIDPDGLLVTAHGYHVLNVDGDPIEIIGDDLQILEDGRIIMDPNDPDALANAEQLFMAYTEQPERFVKEGNGLLRWVPQRGMEDEQPPPGLVFEEPFIAAAAADGQRFFQLQQGFIERSNVDPTRTMTDMLSAFRAYEANQRVIQSYDQTMELAVSQVGRVR